MDRRAHLLPLSRFAALVAVLLAGGCSLARSDGPASDGPAPPPPAGASPEEEGAPELESAEGPSRNAEEPGVRELCRQDREGDEDRVEQSRRALQETFCGATLWFDGLFGGEPDVASARQTSGRVELSSLYSELGGLDLDGRLRLRFELPTLSRRVGLFLGRGDSGELVEDREEGFAARSAAAGVETARAWIAGLAVRGPGRWAEQVEFRAGVEVDVPPEPFVQGRLRQELPSVEGAAWRLRETVFWRHREGFGVTVSADHDRVLTPLWVARWSNIGTLSEASEGVVWRSTGILYRSLGEGRAVAGELFARGATSADVPLREYGVRAIYRQPLGRPHLFGEFVVGYSWPKDDPLQRRTGSPMVGVGTELLFGIRPPYRSDLAGH
jgi:hypothetical protein